MGPLSPNTLIVPCYNESARLDVEALAAFAARDDVRLILVDDGSEDDTRAVLESLRARVPAHITVLAMPRNGGKGAAVRLGLQHALASGAAYVGYFDADLATPLEEVLRLRAVMDARDVAVVLGSRVQRLGADIVRRPLRHYAGRVFATAAALSLGVAVYDTQCGAKLFRVNPTLRAALATPFVSRWAFDVELLGRLVHGVGDAPALGVAQCVEVPLEQWRDVAGSRLRPRAMATAVLDLARIAWSLRHPDRPRPTPSAPPPAGASG